MNCADKKGFAHAPIQLIHGDFLMSTAVKDAMRYAGLVYMNNPRFGPALNLNVLSEPLYRPSMLFASNVFNNFRRSTLPPHSKGVQIDLPRQPDWDPPSNSIQRAADLH